MAWVSCITLLLGTGGPDFRVVGSGISPQMDRQEVLLEDLAAERMADTPPDIHLESPPLQAMGPVSEVPVAEAWIPQAGPQELSYGAAGEGHPPFLDPGRARVPFRFLDFCFESSGALQWWAAWKPITRCNEVTLRKGHSEKGGRTFSPRLAGHKEH